MQNDGLILGKGGQMKVRYIAHLDDIDLTEGAIYKVLSVEKNWYRIVDDSDDDYLYPPDLFEIVEDQLCQKMSELVEKIIVSY